MLLDELLIAPGACVAVVGAGGKTSLCWLLIMELAQRGDSAVFTTTTKIRKPQPGILRNLSFTMVVNPDLNRILDTVQSTASPPSREFALCAASAVEGAPDETPVPDSLMPVFRTKLLGFAADDICSVYRSCSRVSPAHPITFVVEADGARGLLLKAPAEHEPVIPACATTVCVVASLDAIGRPLDESVAHRLERISQLTGTQVGQPISAQLIADLLAHPQGGLKDIPPAARRVAMLTQRNERVAHPEAAYVLKELVTRGYDHALVISPRATHSDVRLLREV